MTNMNGRVVGGPHDGERHDRFDASPGSRLELPDDAGRRISYRMVIAEDHSHYWVPEEKTA
jgi:hypothetical protein